jgi:putative acyl-CoA dehydrogenase
MEPPAQTFSINLLTCIGTLSSEMNLYRSEIMSDSKTKWLSETHELVNQVPPLSNYNLLTSDHALKEALHREGAAWAEEKVSAYGQIAGHEMFALGFQANENKPVLKTHNHSGERINQVVYHPAYHRLMALAVSHGLPSLPWSDPKSGAHVARAAMEYIHNQAESGTGCPLTMTFACVPTLRHQPDIAKLWEPKILSTEYDARDIPYEQKTGLMIGMAMTEKQGGSDVRSNSTQAYAIGVEGSGEAYELVGHKWFVSAPMSDAFLMLAQSKGGLSCFLVPRWRPDGTRNAFQIQQLKNKVGNISNASSEWELRGAYGTMVGDEGRGVRTIIEMVAMTRFDCMVGSSSLMRQAVAQAIHHAQYRSAFGDVLIKQPLMKNVLADLAIESEAALAMTMRVGRALDNSQENPAEKLFARIAVAIGKFWICKRAPGHIYEAQECLGGTGYIEESILPRLYREAPVNSIWEGSGNVQCLDVLRAIDKEKDILDILLDEIKQALGSNKNFDHFVKFLETEFSDRTNLQYRARRLVEGLAIALQASVLLRAGNELISDSFCSSRLSQEEGKVFGTLPTDIDCDAIIKRAQPMLS